MASTRYVSFVNAHRTCKNIPTGVLCEAGSSHAVGGRGGSRFTLVEGQNENRDRAKVPVSARTRAIPPAQQLHPMQVADAGDTDAKRRPATPPKRPQTRGVGAVESPRSRGE